MDIRVGCFCGWLTWYQRLTHNGNVVKRCTQIYEELNPHLAMNANGKTPAGKATGKICSWIALGETTFEEEPLGPDQVGLSRAD